MFAHCLRKITASFDSKSDEAKMVDHYVSSLLGSCVSQSFKGKRVWSNSWGYNEHLAQDGTYDKACSILRGKGFTVLMNRYEQWGAEHIKFSISW